MNEGKEMMKTVVARTKSNSEGEADGSGTSGVSGMPIPIQVTVRKRGHRISATVKTLEQYKNQTSFLLAGCQCCDTIGWSVVKTFMRVMLPNRRIHSRRGKGFRPETETQSRRRVK